MFITRRVISCTWKRWLYPCVKTLTTITPQAAIPHDSTVNHTNVRKTKKWRPSNTFRKSSIAVRQVLNVAFPNDAEKRLQIKSSRIRRNFLEDSPIYLSTSMLIVQQNYDHEAFSKIIDFDRLMAHIGFPNVTINEVFTDANFQSSVSLAVLDNCDSMSDAIFIDALLLMFRLKSRIQDNNVLELQCLERLGSLSLNNILLIADWWILSGYKSQRYHQQMLNSLRDAVNQLSTEHVLQLCYCVSMYKDVPKSFFNDILKLLNNKIESLSWSGVAKVCSAIIKCQEKVENNDRLLYQIGDHVAKNVQDISAHDLTIILRSFSRLYFFHHKFIEATSVHLTEKLKDMTMEMVAHNAFALARFRVLNQPFMDAVAKMVMEEKMMNLRIKSIWMLLRAFTRLNYEPPGADEFFGKCVDLMHQCEHQCREFPFQFLRALISLAYLNRYYDSLLSVLFEPTFLDLCIKRSPSGVDKHLHFLSTCMEIDYPDYNGHKLPKGSVSLDHSGSLQDLSFIRDFKTNVNEISEILQQLSGGPKFIKLHCILNHSGYFSTVADIEMHLDVNGKPIELNDETHALDKVNKLAVLILSQSHCLQDSDRLHGAQAMKVRHLTKLGYTVVQIKSGEWKELTDTEKKKHLISRIGLVVDD